MNKLLAQILNVLVLFLLASNLAAAQDQSGFPKALHPFLSQETVAIGVIDLQRVDLEEMVELQTGLSGHSKRSAAGLLKQAKQSQAKIKQLHEAGVDKLFLLSPIQEFSVQKTVWLGFVNDKKDVETAKNKLTELQQTLDIKREPIAKGNVLVGSFMEKYTQQILSANPQPAEIAETALASLAKFDIGVAIIGSPDTRKVLAELNPDFADPFGNLNGKMIANDVQWSSMGLSFKNKTGSLIVQCSDNRTSKQLAAAAEKLIPFLQSKSLLDPPVAAYINENFKAEANESRLVADLSDLFKEDGLTLLMKEVTAQQGQKEQMKRLQLIAKGCHKFEEANKKLPATANYDKEGKPLLSWRVHILPYMNQNNLYKLFRLDEPWDSEHNIKLLKMLPDCYFGMAANPNQDNLEAGKTIYLRPTGKGTLFDGSTAPTFAMMTDGTVSTMLAVVAGDDHAVEWTRPVDWKFDSEKPWQGLGVKKGEKLKIVTADGAGHRIRDDIDDVQLRNLVNPQDGDIVRMDDLK
jgi:hypothetical protein